MQSPKYDSKIWKVLELCSTPKRFSELKKNLDITDEGLSKNLQSLIKQGLIRKTLEGLYEATDKGKEVVEKEDNAETARRDTTVNLKLRRLEKTGIMLELLKGFISQYIYSTFEPPDSCETFGLEGKKLSEAQERNEKEGHRIEALRNLAPQITDKIRLLHMIINEYDYSYREIYPDIYEAVSMILKYGELDPSKVYIGEIEKWWKKKDDMKEYCRIILSHIIPSDIWPDGTKQFFDKTEAFVQSKSYQILPDELKEPFWRPASLTSSTM